jgi:hypothetical protein
VEVEVGADGNIRNSHATLKNTTRGGDKWHLKHRANQGNMETLASHGAGEERRGMRTHPRRDRSGLHINLGGGQPAQHVVCASDMDDEGVLSAARGQQFARVHPFRGGCMPCQLCQKAVAWPPKEPNFVTSKGMKRMSGRLFIPSEYLSNLVFSARHRVTSGDGGLETPDKPESTASIASVEPHRVLGLGATSGARPHPGPHFSCVEVSAMR